MKDSKAVRTSINEFYATLASASAKRAVNVVQMDAHPSGADRWADATEKWLKRAGATATKWRFRLP